MGDGKPTDSIAFAGIAISDDINGRRVIEVHALRCGNFGIVVHSAIGNNDKPEHSQGLHLFPETFAALHALMSDLLEGRRAMTLINKEPPHG